MVGIERKNIKKLLLYIVDLKNNTAENVEEAEKTRRVIQIVSHLSTHTL